jgi:2,4-dienoyl-CoA reductase-like NADH-dependent reductase (Old Yellow Enzyme family)
MVVGGYGLVMVEASAVSPEGRISPHDMGIWSDVQAELLSHVPEFAHERGVKAGIQLAHAGRKASCDAPWRGGSSLDLDQGGWQKLGPSAVAFEGYHEPRAMTQADIDQVVQDFTAAAGRAVAAGFDVIEVHAAHGYLLHEFLSPLANHRTDVYGGDFDNRIRLTCEVVSAVRTVVPADRAFFVRISATDWIEGGWDLDHSTALARELHARGVDLVDCSSGGLSAAQQIPVAPGYQVPLARTIAQEAGVPVCAVGIITSGPQAEEILADGTIAAVMVGRATLGNPRWPYQAAQDLGEAVPWPDQYARGFLPRH